MFTAAIKSQFLCSVVSPTVHNRTYSRIARGNQIYSLSRVEVEFCNIDNLTYGRHLFFLLVTLRKLLVGSLVPLHAVSHRDKIHRHLNGAETEYATIYAETL